MISKQILTGEDENEETELKYLQFIKNIRDDEPDLFEKIKRFPKKSRSAKIENNFPNSLLTYFRKGKVQKFFIATNEGTKELDFLAAARMMESTPDAARQKVPEAY